MNAQPISWFRAGGERPVGGNTVWTKPVDDEPEFFISSFCNSVQCVAVAFMRQSKTVLVRHHRSGDGGPTLEFSTAEWDAFIAGVRRGEFDVPGAPVGDMPRKPNGTVDLDAMDRTGSKDSNAVVDGAIEREASRRLRALLDPTTGAST